VYTCTVSQEVQSRSGCPITDHYYSGFIFNTVPLAALQLGKCLWKNSWKLKTKKQQYCMILNIFHKIEFKNTFFEHKQQKVQGPDSWSSGLYIQRHFGFDQKFWSFIREIFFQSILPLQLRAFSVEWFTFWKLDSCQIFINSAMRFPYQLLLSQIHRSFGQMQNTLTSPRCSGSQDLRVDKGYIYVTWLFLVHWLLNRPKLALKKAWSLYHL